MFINVMALSDDEKKREKPLSDEMMNTKLMYQALELYRVISDLFDAEFMNDKKQIISVKCKRLSELKDKTKSRYQRRGGVQ